MIPLNKQSRIYCETFESLQKEQKSIKSRIFSGKRVLNDDQFKDAMWTCLDPVNDVLDLLSVNMLRLITQYPPYPNFLSDIPMQEELMLRILCEVKDIRRFKNPSSLWKYAGYAPALKCQICGKRVFTDEEFNSLNSRNYNRINENTIRCSCKNRDVQNNGTPHIFGIGKQEYNHKLKKAMDAGVEDLLKDPFYQDLYQIYKEKELDKGISEEHAENRAKRKIKKLFLYHLFNEWRIAVGLDPIKSYCGLPNYRG